MHHFPNHPIDQTKFTFSEMWEEYWRLKRKWFKSKADKRAMKVLDEAMLMYVIQMKSKLPQFF